MGTTKKVKVEVTYRVPTWNYCNIRGGLGSNYGPEQEKCRFCTTAEVLDTVDAPLSPSNRGRFGASSVRQKTIKRVVTVCSLYNTPLLVQEGILVQKCKQCCRNTAGFREPVNCELGDGDELYRSRALEELVGKAPIDEDSAVTIMRKYSKELKKNLQDGHSLSRAEAMAELTILEEMSK